MQGRLSPEVIARAALNGADFKPSRSLGQNFLLGEELLEGLLDEIMLPSDARVFEIGPGAGVMTALMEARGARVTAVEVDRHLRPVLESVLREHPRAKVLFEDARKLPMEGFVETQFGSLPYFVVANLPYYITTEIVEKLATLVHSPEAICVMVQQEAAERILAQPGESQWCHLSAVTSLYGTGRVLRRIPRSCFEPAPHVDSCFLCIRRHETPIVTPIDMKVYRKVLKAAFFMRRKTLLNNLKAVFSLTREEVEEVLRQADTPANARGEALTLSELGCVSDALTVNGRTKATV